MVQRRFLALVGLILCGAVVLIVRLYQLQIVEHPIWANEAANLVRSGSIVPFTRGRLMDRKGRTIVRDEELYRVEFVYRDFRRRHPLGLLTHARSTLECRAVGLEQGLQNLVPWSLELFALSPKQLSEWARGAELSCGDYFSAATEEPVAEHRRSRARDLGFYIGRLAALSRRESDDLHKLLRESKESRSFLELFADWREMRGEAGVQSFQRNLIERLERSIADLGSLSRLLDGVQTSTGSSGSGRLLTPSYSSSSPKSLPLLVADLEACRKRVEDGTAGRLFREASGFHVGRVEPALSFEAMDLDWIAVRLRWDAERVLTWLRGARGTWLGWRDSYCVETLAAELQLQAGRAGWSRRGPESLFTELAALYADVERETLGQDRPERSWRWANQLRVVEELGSLFVGAGWSSEDPSGERPVMPFRSTDLRGTGAQDQHSRYASSDAWELSGAMSRWGRESAGSPLAERSARKNAGLVWRSVFSPNFSRRRLDPLVRQEWGHWEDLLQAEIRDLLSRAWRSADDSQELGRDQRLRFREERLDRATERAAYIRRDLGSRSQSLARDPDYEVVHLLNRYPDRFAGFHVRDTHVRVFDALDPDGQPVAETLIGSVRQSDVRELRAQREEAEELRELVGLGIKSDVQEDRIAELVPRVVRPEEVRGAEGLEALLEPFLAGHNGYEERRGMQDLRDPDSRPRWFVPPVDGLDVRLTLDLDLQVAAQQCLEQPNPDPDPNARDDEWLSHPVGAICLVDLNGDILAAFSAPSVAVNDGPWVADGQAPPQWALPLERTLRKPTFQPPGSVFKPFVAAWALEHTSLDPKLEHECAYSPLAGQAGYKSLRCWRRSGHGHVGLRGALKGSCNAYFAHLGEQLTNRQFQLVLNDFGFGQPTGVNAVPRNSRELGELVGNDAWTPAAAPAKGASSAGRVREESVVSMRRLHLSSKGRDHLMAGNGLGVVEANPMQVARATAALATGYLPELRLVDSVQGVELPRNSRPLSVGAESRRLVAEAMLAVTSERDGTAYKAKMLPAELGFSVAAKTGSADLIARTEDGKVKLRKHTWFAGWFPADKPRAALVVFCHDTTVTASHSAIWIAKDFLARPEVKAYLREVGDAQ